ncbi:MAG: uracil-DNA glycosylase [Actinobacteria bacterium]|nr:uracil-DNA glycosylase [Actinomycetota bacterium]
MHRDWGTFLAIEREKPYFRELTAFVAHERANHVVHPPDAMVFRALEATPLDTTKVVVLGQDPYHGAGQANGLAFSVDRDVTVPPSLRNILREFHDDTGLPLPGHGDLRPWAEQGVLLLNTTLTVRDGEAASHSGHGWESFTDAVIRTLDARTERTVFLLWGTHARAKRALLSNPAHAVIESAHPSPLSARKGFFGSRPFTRTNNLLVEAGREPVDWALPAAEEG